MAAGICPVGLAQADGLRCAVEPKALAGLRADSVVDSPLAVALAVRATMREYRRGKPVAFQTHSTRGAS